MGGLFNYYHIPCYLYILSTKSYYAYIGIFVIYSIHYLSSANNNLKFKEELRYEEIINITYYFSSFKCPFLLDVTVLK